MRKEIGQGQIKLKTNIVHECTPYAIDRYMYIRPPPPFQEYFNFCPNAKIHVMANELKY